MIIWDPPKNEWLKKNRGVSFEEVKKMIESGSYLAIVDNPARHRQFICVVRLNNYAHAVPFIVDKDKNIVLKTVYPSRKYNKMYS